MAAFVTQAIDFFQDIRAEFRRVTWPDRPQLQRATIAVIVFVLIIAGFIAILDLILQGILAKAIPALLGK